MNRFEFEQLSQSEQMQVVNRYGTYLAEKIVSGDRLYLYAVNSFYVELLYSLSNISNSKLVVERVFDDTQDLKNYFDDMIVSSLFG